ncbi:MAG: response regulator transcription factor [Myxococcales bacterium]|nr:response regulator transcription factor [Myxococcales bacterium]MCB9669622.1 response regulator transcription factor [Alphaproteobacteria bacterium]
MTFRIGIVDDHPLFRFGIRALLRELPDVIVEGEAADASEALALIARCDLVTLDLDLPDISGTSLLERALGLKHHARLLVVSMLDEELYAERCVRAGASGFLAKTDAPGQLLRAVEVVRRGEIFLSQRVLQGVARRLAGGGDTIDPMGSLSPRELEIFRLMGKGESSGGIAHVLHISTKTVEAHQANLRRKLGHGSMLDLRRAALLWWIEDARSAG